MTVGVTVLAIISGLETDTAGKQVMEKGLMREYGELWAGCWESWRRV